MQLSNSFRGRDDAHRGKRRLRFETLEDRRLLAAAPTGNSGPGAEEFDSGVIESDESASEVVGFEGTSGDDVFRVSPDLEQGGWTVRVNGVPLSVPATTVSFVLDGQDGHDVVTLVGTDGDDLVELWPGHGTLTGEGYSVAIGDVEAVMVHGGGGTDVALLRDDPAGRDTFRAKPEVATLFGDGYSNRVRSFRYVHAYSTIGNNDVALLHGAPNAADTFKARPGVAKLFGDDYYTRAKSFRYVHAYGAIGNNDVALLHGDPNAADTFEAWPETAKLFGDDYYTRAKSFRYVHAYGTTGNADVALLHGDPNSTDTFEAWPETAKLFGDDYYTRAKSFRYVHAYGTTGNADVALLHGDPNSTDTFEAWPDAARLFSDGYFHRAKSFRYVHAYGAVGNKDVALLHGDPNSTDTFEAWPDAARLFSDGYFHRVKWFRYVHAYGTTGNTDMALLHGDPNAADTFETWPDAAKLFNDGYFHRVKWFRYVHAYGTADNNDVALLHDDSHTADTFEATPEHVRLYSDGFYHRAVSFGRVTAHATGGSDRARFYDSDGDDHFRAVGALAELATSDLQARAYGFPRVDVLSDRGGYDTKYQDAADYVLQTAGDWCSLVALDGQAFARIVVPDNATTAEQFAAEELQSYLLQISGAELPIEREGAPGKGARFLIGATSFGEQALLALSAEGPETFVVRSLGDDVLLAGLTQRATLYAVYDYLEDDLHCRWLGPGPDWEEVPTMSKIGSRTADRTESPAMEYRYLRTTTVAEPGSWDDYMMSWAVKQKINATNGWPPTELPEPTTLRGGFRAWMTPHRAIGSLLPPSEHFAEHPEWYALVDGRRRNYGDWRTQLCTTNPEAVARVAEGLGQVFDARPEIDFLPLGAADKLTFCECDRCTALDTGEIWPIPGWEFPVITERWLTFINEVARRLQETHPDKKIYTLAYHQTFRPPDPEVIMPEPNVIIQVVNSRPNYVCFVHRLENDDCANHVKFRQKLEAWAAMTSGGVMGYEYVPHTTFCAMPYPAPHKFISDIKCLHSVGAVGFQGQSFSDTWGTYGVSLYAIAKATWDSNVDADALVQDYCDNAFHDASEPMQRFIKTIEDGLVEADHITEGIWSYMTPEVMAEARLHLDAAHQTTTSPTVERRLRAIEVGFHYGEMGSSAWAQAQEALANQDPVLLEQAIALAESAAEYCLEEQQIDPHYAAVPGKLTSVYVKRWKRELDELNSAAGVAVVPTASSNQESEIAAEENLASLYYERHDQTESGLRSTKEWELERAIRESLFVGMSGHFEVQFRPVDTDRRDLREPATPMQLSDASRPELSRATSDSSGLCVSITDRFEEEGRVGIIKPVRAFGSVPLAGHGVDFEALDDPFALLLAEVFGTHEEDSSETT